MEVDLQDEEDRPDQEAELTDSNTSTTHDETNDQGNEENLGVSDGEDGRIERPLDGLYDQLRASLNHTKAGRLLEKRWNRIKKYYVDDYRALFQQEMLRTDQLEQSSDQSQNEINLTKLKHSPSQIGIVTWGWDEKVRLYEALSRHGRHDLPALAEAIGSKSILEVADFLHAMQDQLYEHHTFSKRVDGKSIRAEIPAATEVPTMCRNALTKAADALLVLQERHDHLVTHQNKAGQWSQLRVDDKIAEIFDEIALCLQGEDEEEDEEMPADLVELLGSTELFHVHEIVSLSTNVFMNSGENQKHNNWRTLAVDEYEEPAILLESLCEFHDLVTNFTRKIVQATIFVAQSRNRCIFKRDKRRNNTENPGEILMEDAIAALDVLGLPRLDSWNYWEAVPTRCGLSVLRDEDRIEELTAVPDDVFDVKLVAKTHKDGKSLSWTWAEIPKMTRERLAAMQKHARGDEEDDTDSDSDVEPQSLPEATTSQDSAHVHDSILTSDIDTGQAAQLFTTMESGSYPDDDLFGSSPIIQPQSNEPETHPEQSLSVSSPIIQPQSDSDSDDPRYVPSRSPSKSSTLSSAPRTASRSPSFSPSASPTASALPSSQSSPPSSPTFVEFIPMSPADHDLLRRDDNDVIEEPYLEAIDHISGLADTARLWDVLATNPAYSERGLVPERPNPSAEATANVIKAFRSINDAQRLMENELLELKWEDKLEWRAEWEETERIRSRERAKMAQAKRGRAVIGEAEAGREVERDGDGNGEEGAGGGARRKRRRVVPSVVEDDGEHAEGEEATSGQETRSASEMLDELFDDVDVQNDANDVSDGNDDENDDDDNEYDGFNNENSDQIDES